MSEYQYYEFLAVDRPLSDADRKALRKLSSRAEITARRFTNSYEWGDFRGDPCAMMERWFDLHLYLANWGTRRLMIKLPRRLVDGDRLAAMMDGVEGFELTTAGEALIVDITRNEEGGYDEWSDESEWLEMLAPLRDDVLAGDLRVFYLAWLVGVETETVGEETLEPLPGLGPMTDALQAFADFFVLDPDLVAAAAERPAAPHAERISAEEVRRRIAAMDGPAKTGLLVRLFEGDPHVATELRSMIQDRNGASVPAAGPRTASALWDRAEEIRQARENAEAEAAEAQRRLRAEQEELERQLHLKAIRRRGERVWDDIETEIARRNSGGYNAATELLIGLQDIAESDGTLNDFLVRLNSVRQRHAAKAAFVKRLRMFQSIQLL
ncbi:MAG TPA: hypothetical protein VFG62_03965 [Rhodopila sp.]|jgi:hypothetical protein|nr:hypothetical protein [Rhodopila sp.]